MRFSLTTLCLLFSLHISAQSILIAAQEKGKLYGYINEKGEYVIPPSFDDAGPFYQDVAVVLKGKLYGVINSKGEMLVAPTYEKAITYAPEGKITVMKNGKWGVIDRNGKVLIPIQYPYLSVFKNGFVVGGNVLTEKSFSGKICPLILNEKADTVFIQDDCSDMPDLLTGELNKKGDYSEVWPIVRDGKLILRGGYENEVMAFDVSKNYKAYLTSISVESGYGFREGVMPAYFTPEGPTRDAIYIDSTGLSHTYEYQNAFQDLKADRIYPFFNGVAAIEQEGKWSFLDRNGVVTKTNLSVEEYRASPPMYFNGLIGFFKKGKAGYVNIKGETVIPFQFSEYHPFEFDITPVELNGKYGLIRKDGTWAVPPKFQNLYLSPCPCYQ